MCRASSCSESSVNLVATSWHDAIPWGSSSAPPHPHLWPTREPCEPGHIHPSMRCASLSARLCLLRVGSFAALRRDDAACRSAPRLGPLVGTGVGCRCASSTIVRVVENGRHLLQVVKLSVGPASSLFLSLYSVPGICKATWVPIHTQRSSGQKECESTRPSTPYYIQRDCSYLSTQYGVQGCKLGWKRSGYEEARGARKYPCSCQCPQKRG